MSIASVSKRLAIAILSIIAVITIVLCFIVFTTRGTQWALNISTTLAERYVDNLSIQWGKSLDQGTIIDKPLYKGLQLAHLRWHDDNNLIQANDVEIDIQNHCELSLAEGKYQTLRACIEQIYIGRIDIVTRSGDEDKQQATRDSDINLPALRSPWPLLIEAVHLQQLNWHSTDSPPSQFELNHKQATASLQIDIDTVTWLNDHISLSSLQLSGNGPGVNTITLQTNGKLRASGAYPLSLAIDIDASTEFLPTPLQTSISLSNTLRDLELEAQVTSPENIMLEGHISALSSKPSAELSIGADTLTPTRWNHGIEAPALQNLHAEIHLKEEGDIQLLVDSLLDLQLAEKTKTDLHIDTVLSRKPDAYSILLNQLQLGDSHHHLKAKGILTASTNQSANELATHLHVQAKQFHASSKDYPWLAGSLTNGNAEIKVRQQGAIGNALISIKQLDGRWQQHTLQGQGHIKANWPGKITIDSITLRMADSELQADGSFPLANINSVPWQNSQQLADWLSNSQFKIEAKAPNLGVFSPQWQGQLTLDASHQHQAPIYINATASAIQAPIFRAEHIDTKISIDPDKNLASNLTLQAKALGQQQTLEAVSIELSGDRYHQQLTAQSDDATTPFFVGIRGRFDQHYREWRGSLNELTAAYHKQNQRSTATLENTVDVQFARDSQQIKLSPFCIALAAGKLCTTETLASPGELSVTLKASDIEQASLAAIIPERLQWLGKASLEASVSQQKGQALHIDADLISTEGSIGANTLSDNSIDPEPSDKNNDREQIDSGTAYLQYRELRSTARLRGNDFSGELHFKDQHNSETTAAIQLFGEKFSSMNASINTVGFPLAAINPLTDQLYAHKGLIQLQLEATGDISKPDIHGQLHLRDGELSLSAVSSVIKQLQVTGTFNQQQLNIDGDFTFGDGPSRLAGKIDFSDHQPKGSIQIATHDARIIVPPTVDIVSTLALSATIDRNHIELTGDISVPKGKITVQQLPSSAANVSSDIVYTGSDADKLPQSTPLSFSSKLKLILGPDIEFSGFGASAKLDGLLQLEQSPTTPAMAQGEINIVQGKYRAYGQKLDIRRGRLLFAGAVQQPNIDVEAIRKVEDSTVGVRVSGFASAPELTPFSEPNMPDQDILFRLITGRAPGAKTDANEERLLAQAALASTLKAGGGAVSETAEKLGIDNFAIGTGDESDLLVSGYLDPSLYVEYGVGLFGEGSVFKLRWSLAEKLALEFVSGLQNSLDLIYSLEF